MKQILALTDFSKRSNDALITAFEMARKNEATLTIYHNLNEGELLSFDLSSSSQPEFIEDNDKSKTNLISEWKELAQNLAVKTNFIISSDNFVTRVQSIVEKIEADLIIMAGTPEKERVDSRWFSNTQAVVNHVDCPVLVLKNENTPVAFKNVVYASNFDQKDKAVFSHFLKLFKIDTDTIIHLLAIDTSSQFSQPRILMEEAMKDFTKIAYPIKSQTHFYADFTVDRGIRNFLDEMDPDLLIMGNKNNKPIKHFLFGNSAVQALTKIEKPILVIDFSDFEAKQMLNLDTLTS